MDIQLDSSSYVAIAVLTAVGVWWGRTRRQHPSACQPDPLPPAPPEPLTIAPAPVMPPDLLDASEPVVAPATPALHALEERLRRLEASLPEAPPLEIPVEAPRPPRLITPPDAALDTRLVRLLKAGAPVPEIARALNCSRAEVDLLLALRRTRAEALPDDGQMPLPL